MVNPILKETRNKIINLWFAGRTYQEIWRDTGVSTGTVSSIIQEYRRAVPDSADLRKLQKNLIQLNARIPDALRATIFLDQLNALNISVDQIRACVDLFTSYGEKSGDILEAGLRLKGLEASQGKTYETILEEATDKSLSLDALTTRVSNLEKKEHTLLDSLRNLDALKTLQDTLSRHHISTSQLNGFIQQHLTFAQLGFTTQTATTLASALNKVNIDPLIAAATLPSLLSQHQNLEAAIGQLLRDKRALQDDIESYNSQIQTLQKQVESLKDAIQAYKDLEGRALDSYNLNISKFQNTYDSKRVKLDTEIKNREATLEQLKKAEETSTQSLRDSEISLKDLEQKIWALRPALAVLALMKNPKTSFDAISFMDVCLVFIGNMIVFLEFNEKTITETINLRMHLKRVQKELTTHVNLRRQGIY
ncbi:MAG: hypothetical protein V1915_01810 [Candidatus Bathyarchaeota archaeon]